MTKASTRPGPFELSTLTQYNKDEHDDDAATESIGIGIGLFPPMPDEETLSRAPSPIPGSLDPDSAFDHTAPLSGIITLY